MTIQRFSDIGITAGGSPVANAAALRSWAGENKAILIDDAGASYDFDTQGTPINLAFSKLAIIAESPRAVLRHVAGAGRFLSFDGQSQYPGRDAVKRITFGEPGRPIMVRGAVGAGTTDLLYGNKMGDCHFDVHLRDADVLFRVDGAGQPVGSQIGAVECTFNVTSSPDWDDEAFVVGSRYGFLATNCYNNRGASTSKAVGCCMAPSSPVRVTRSTSTRAIATTSQPVHRPRATGRAERGSRRPAKAIRRARPTMKRMAEIRRAGPISTGSSGEPATLPTTSPDVARSTAPTTSSRAAPCRTVS